jgi:hypothetical protein
MWIIFQWSIWLLRWHPGQDLILFWANRLRKICWKLALGISCILDCWNRRSQTPSLIAMLSPGISCSTNGNHPVWLLMVSNIINASVETRKYINFGWIRMRNGSMCRQRNWRNLCLPRSKGRREMFWAARRGSGEVLTTRNRRLRSNVRPRWIGVHTAGARKERAAIRKLEIRREKQRLKSVSNVYPAWLLRRRHVHQRASWVLQQAVT